MSEPNLTEPQSEAERHSNQKSNWSQEIGNSLRKNWPKYVAEIFVIIIGITSSFMIDNFKDEAKQREEEKFYLRNLLLDLNEDIDKLNALIAGSDTVVKNADYFLRLLRENRVTEINDNQFTVHWIGLFYWNNFKSSDATFLDLKSGNANFIGDPTLRLSIFDYYTFLGSVSKYELIEHDQMINIIQPYFFNHFAMKGTNSKKVIAFPNDHNWNELKSDMFENVIGSRFIQRDGLKVYYRQALDLALKAKAKLEERKLD